MSSDNQDQVLAAIGVVDGTTTVFEITEAQAAAYRATDRRLINFMIGQVMKATGGRANPQQVREIVTAKLEALRDAYLREHAYVGEEGESV